MSWWINLAVNVWAGISLAVLVLLIVVFGVSFWRKELADRLLELLIGLQVFLSIPAIIVFIVRSLPLLITVMSILIAGLFLLLGFAWISGVIQRRRKRNGGNRPLPSAERNELARNSRQDRFRRP